MKRILQVALMGCVVLGLAASCFSQSLGDIAREQRKEKKQPAKKVYTNDNLPTSGTVNVPGNATGPESKDNEGKTDAKEEKSLDDLDKEQKKLEDGWSKKITAQKNIIEKLSGELQVLQRDYKVQITNYYNDAGSRLRNETEWVEKRVKYETDIEATQKQLEEAKQKLEDMQEEARRAGISTKAIE